VTGKARHRGWVGLASTVLLLSALAPVRAAVEAELIDRQLESQPVRLQVLSDGEMMYFGADRTLKRQPMSRFVAVRFRGSAEADPEDQQGRVERTDGQRLTGNLLAGREDGQGLRWEHPDLGEASLSLDDLSRFHRPGAEPTEPAGGDDRVVLRNGDVLTGFVEAVQPDQLMLDPAEGDELVPLPLENIAAVALANRRRPWPADTHRLRLAAGSRLAIETLELRDDGLAVDTDWLGSGLNLPIDAVNVIELTSGGLRLVDLTDRPREVTGGGAVFGVTMPPRAGGPPAPSVHRATNSAGDSVYAIERTFVRSGGARESRCRQASVLDWLSDGVNNNTFETPSSSESSVSLSRLPRSAIPQPRCALP